MKRRLIIFLIILTIFLSGLNGLVKFLATRPDATGTTPTLFTVAEAEPENVPTVSPAPTKPPSGGGASTNGGSWGG